MHKKLAAFAAACALALVGAGCTQTTSLDVTARQDVPTPVVSDPGGQPASAGISASEIDATVDAAIDAALQEDTSSSAAADASVEAANDKTSLDAVANGSYDLQ